MKMNPIIGYLRCLCKLAIPAVICAVFLIGCGSGATQETLVAQKAELEKLQAESKEATRLRAENRELARLRRDNQEIENLKNSAAEIARLRTENEDIRSGMAAITEQAKKTRQQQMLEAEQASAAGQPGGGVAGGVGVAGVEAVDSNIPQEGDEILIEPRLLVNILPDFDWESIERTQPIAVKALLDQQGIVLTNYQQLIEIGITNYIIQKAPPPVPNQVTQ